MSATVQDRSIMRVGPVSYSLTRRELMGPRGVVTLPRQQSMLAALLFRSPGHEFPSARIISVIWPDPDEEPDTAETIVRRRIMELRQALAAISSDRVGIHCSRDFGYRIEEKPR